MPDLGLSGAILAGGQSTRMGRDKAFLPFPAPDGPPLIAHQCALLRDLGIDDLLISGRPDTDYASAVPHARVVLDTQSDSGPLAGLAAVLAAARHPRVLVMAIDHPRMTANYLRKLIHISNQSTGVVPSGPHGFEPLIAIYPCSLLPHIQQALVTGQFSLQTLLTKAIKSSVIQSVKLDEDELPLFANWNTPQDLKS
jgi:molybdopterin-guanine dinucleotide biosynthesis protein A